MQVVSRLRDNRIDSWNVLVEVSLREYADLIRGNLDQNPFQRKRVSSSKSVYSLLKSDIAQGCVVPPVVLALPGTVPDPASLSDKELAVAIADNSKSLMILDGLQRTHTIIDYLAELDPSATDSAVPLRIEVYLGLNRLGILYRMLTLNTGQTPMSLRQQIEMIYTDYQGKTLSGDVELLAESDSKYATKPFQFNFKDVVEGYNSYISRDELPMDRSTVLDNIRTLERLAAENQDSDVFEKYVAVVHSMVTLLDSLGDVSLPPEFSDTITSPFGANLLKVFKRPQALSGLGAALGKLIDRGVLANVEDGSALLEKSGSSDPEDLLVRLNESLDWLKNNTTKIGNAQRSYFTYFFRELFNDDTDSYLKLNDAAVSALRKYQDQNG
ncbi:hypothetical protein ASF30_14785 [Leifsonia sp. Leaf264]|nr:hypothetical protein ASF30_14785 [Leifsonia sp. Leaf264]